jgi:hypothetical protein
MPAGAGTHDTTVTVWLHVLLLPQASVNSQVRVMTHGQGALFVTSPVQVIVTLLPQQEEPTGRSNAQFVPHGTVLLLGQETRSGQQQLVNSARKAVGESEFVFPRV